MAISASNSVNIYTSAYPSQYPYVLSTYFEEIGTSTTNNTSTISASASIVGNDIRFSGTNCTLALYWFDDYYNTNGLYINSITVTSTTRGVANSVSGTFDVTHNTNGSLNGYIKAIWTREGSNSYAPPTTELSTAYTALTSIPRTSVLNSLDINVSSGVITPNITKYYSGYYDTLNIYSGNYTITINGVTNGTAVTLSSSQISTLYKMVGTSLSATVSAYLTTKTSSSGSVIGNSSVVAVVVTLPSYSLNWVTQSCVDSITTYDTYKTNSTDLIANLSKPKLTFSANSSTGTTYGQTINYLINNVSVTSPTIYNAYGGQSFNVKATDNRKSITWTPTNTIIPYVMPTLKCEVKRPSATGSTAIVTLTSTYYDGNGLQNLKDLNFLFEYAETNGETKTISSFTEEAFVTVNHIVTTKRTATISGLNYRKAITFTATMTDLLGISSNSASGKIPKGKPVWNCYTDYDDEGHFNVNGILEVNGEMIKNPYPVGSIYISVNSTNPSDLFGGTWEQIKGRFLLGTGQPDDNENTWWGTDLTYNGTDKYSQGAGETGGSSRHTLSINEMPAHNHNTNVYFTGGYGSDQYTLDWSNGPWQGPYSQALGALTMDNTGGGLAHNNMPPYMAVYMWKRVA